MWPEILGGRVEHDDLTHARRDDLVVPGLERPQVQVADRAPGEPPELQVDKPCRVRNGDHRAGDCLELPCADHLGSLS
jgi:hypothetical protein